MVNWNLSPISQPAIPQIEHLAEIEPVPLPELDAASPVVVRAAAWVDNVTAGRRYRSTVVRSVSSGVAQSIGKLVMNWPGREAAGTAWVVARCAIATAAHCVFDPAHGGWPQTIEFYPQYADGRTLGRWFGTTVHLYRAWTQDRNFEWDFAICTLDGALPSQIPRIRFGRGLTGRPPREWRALGYPGKARPGYGFEGRKIWQCTGDSVPPRGRLLHGMVSNLTPGCSGGPWVYLNRNKTPIADGLNSFRYLENRYRMYSPVLDERFGKLYDLVKGLR